MSNRLNTDKEYYEYRYDEIIIPEGMDNVHYKAAIKKRNRWMVDRADHVIAYVYREFGGASETLKYPGSKGNPLSILHQLFSHKHKNAASSMKESLSYSCSPQRGWLFRFSALL